MRRAITRALLRLRIWLDERYIAACCPDGLIASMDRDAWTAHLESLRVRLALLQPHAKPHKAITQ